MMMSPDPTAALVLALNHQLARAERARDRLRPHAGKVARIELASLTLQVLIAADGLVEAAGPDAAPAVTIRINPADLPLILQDPQRAIAHVRLEGDADLAQALSDLRNLLDLDMEDQLSQIFGDLAGRRMALTGRVLVAHARDTAQKVQENLAEYFLEENPMLLRPADVAGFGEQVGRLRDDVERLMKRIEKLENRKK